LTQPLLGAIIHCENAHSELYNADAPFNIIPDYDWRTNVPQHPTMGHKSSALHNAVLKLHVLVSTFKPVLPKIPISGLSFGGGGSTYACINEQFIRFIHISQCQYID